MADDRPKEGPAERPAVGGGASDDTGGLVERESRIDADRQDLGVADRRPGEAVDGAGSAPAPGPRGGRLSGEGTGDPQAGATDPGDPGGMGGARARAGTRNHRPPGGVGPADERRDGGGEG